MPDRKREDRSSPLTLIAAGALGAIAARRLLTRAILLKLRRDLRALNAGDYQPLLAAFADDAVLVFNEGEHRWAGEHRGKPAIERFFRDFVAAGLTGEIVDLFLAGPPWALTLIVRFDDEARGADGELIYSNRTLLLVRSRRGKIVRQEDYYADTVRIGELDATLTELGIAPATIGSQA
jgi:ketosteroid isomerase-like protein